MASDRWRDPDLRIGVGESLLELALGLDARILHVFEVLAHILHLVLQVGQVGVLPCGALNHLPLSFSFEFSAVMAVFSRPLCLMN